MTTTDSMNHVERFRAVMNFESIDRLPRIEWAMWWGKTIERWKKEGLPASLNETFDISQYFGLDPYFQYTFSPYAKALPEPQPHGQGVVTGPDEYEKLQKHFFPPQDSAFDILSLWSKIQSRGEAVVWITLPGFFWFPRTLFGIERHFYAFYDHAELMHRMNRELADYYTKLLRRLVGFCQPTFMTFAEDMSYNHGPMLSKQLFDEFISPYYRRVVPRLKEMNICVFVDSDGDVTELMPWLREIGVDGILPLERQAGVDVGVLRQTLPELLMIGHYDKMVMSHGEKAMRDEFERLLPVMKVGGFIPSVDHQTPPCVSLEQYRCYIHLLEEYSTLAAN